MATATVSELTAYCGKPGSTFFDLKRAMAEIGTVLVLVQTVPEALHLLDTQAIKTIVVGLDRDAETTRLIVAEIRRLRPEIKVLEGGSSLPQVIKDNFLCFSRGLDGTVKFEEFQKAFTKAQVQRRALLRNMILIALGILAILISVMFFTSPIARFFGAFWSTILIVEFSYVLFCYSKRMIRSAKWLPNPLNQ